MALLSLCRCAGSFRHFLCIHMQKPTAKLVLTSGRSAKGRWSAWCTYAHSRESLRSTCECICCKYFKLVRETVLVFGVPVQTVKYPLRLLRCLFCFENVAHKQWAILWECTYLMRIQYWPKPACAFVLSCKSIYCLHAVYLSHMHIHVTIFNMQTQLSSRLQF